MAIEEKLSAKLDQVKPDDEPDDLLRKEITDLTNQLQSAVESAKQEQAAGAWARVKRPGPGRGQRDCRRSDEMRA